MLLISKTSDGHLTEYAVIVVSTFELDYSRLLFHGSSNLGNMYQMTVFL